MSKTEIEINTLFFKYFYQIFNFLQIFLITNTNLCFLIHFTDNYVIIYLDKIAKI